MMQLFEDSAFNEDLFAWHISKVTDMSDMFYDDDVFNSNILAWDVGKVVRWDLLSIRNGVAFVTANQCDLANENGALGTYLPKRIKKLHVFSNA